MKNKRIYHVTRYRQDGYSRGSGASTMRKAMKDWAFIIKMAEKRGETQGRLALEVTWRDCPNR